MTNNDHDAQRARFTKKKPNWASFRRWKIGNYHHGQAAIAAAAGDHEKAEYHLAISRAASAGTLPLSSRPLLPFVGKPPDPPESPG